MAEEPEYSATPREPAKGIGRPSRILGALRRLVLGIIPSSAAGWAVVLFLLACATGYLAERHLTQAADAPKIMNQSVKMEDDTLQGQTEHQVIHVEEVSAGGKVLQKGVVDLWKDGDGGRYLRRLYDGQHKMIGQEWRNKSGAHRSRGASRSRVLGEFWDQDLSARAFRALAGPTPRLQVMPGGYELTTAGPIKGHPQLISATLLLDPHMLPVQTILRVRSGSDIHELRFVQASYERKPRASVPDSIFDPERQAQGHAFSSAPIAHDSLSLSPGMDVQLAELQIAVLYRLHQLSADTGLPIEIKREHDGHIQVIGTVADGGLRQEILNQLSALDNHQLLTLRLMSSQVSKARPGAPTAEGLYEINQAGSAADTVLQAYFQAKGLSGEPLKSAEARFSHDALAHAQSSLQHAYALDRLGRAVSALELQSISPPSQQQWTEMMRQHADSLQEELQAMVEQMKDLSPAATLPANTESASAGIDSPPRFSKAARLLLQQVQQLNRTVSSVFASGVREENQSSPEALATTILHALPLEQAKNMRSFATKLSLSAAPAAMR